MFKVGEYSEQEAKSIADYLKGAGFKVDVKGLVLPRIDFSASLQGRLSELSEKLSVLEKKSKLVQERERYLAALKAALEKGATSESFEDLFLEEVIPGWKEMLARFRALKDASAELDEETEDTFTRSMAECIVSVDFAEKVIDLNEIEFGSPVGSLLDDPIVSIPVRPDDFDDDDPLLYQRMDVDLEKVYEITIDEFSASLFDEIDEEFTHEFIDEFLKIRALGLIINHLMDVAEKGKMDIEEFADLCSIEFGDNWHMSIDGSLVAEEIARSLEKSGMLKMKGNTIKWKG
jgi:hypothetical protein